MLHHTFKLFFIQNHLNGSGTFGSEGNSEAVKETDGGKIKVLKTLPTTTKTQKTKKKERFQNIPRGDENVEKTCKRRRKNEYIL